MSVENKLTNLQAKRLTEILNANDGTWPSWVRNAGRSKVTTRQLVDMGALKIFGGSVASTGRTMSYGSAYLTEAGRAMLAARTTGPDPIDHSGGERG